MVNAVQDLYSTYPTPGNVVLERAGYAAPTRQHELDHTDITDHADHTDQEYSYLYALSDLDHEVGTNALSEVWSVSAEAEESASQAG